MYGIQNKMHLTLLGKLKSQPLRMKQIFYKNSTVSFTDLDLGREMIIFEFILKQASFFKAPEAVVKIG